MRKSLPGKLADELKGFSVSVWMIGLKPGVTIEVLVAGIVLGLGIAKLGLSKISRRNIRRINLLPDKACLFAFQAVIYTTMGFAL